MPMAYALAVLPEFDLTGRKALVTGAGRGIGKGIALVLAEAGADVGVTALGEENAARVAAEVSELGRRGFGWAADGTRVEPMKALAEKVLSEMGGLDILVNCIGDAIPGSIAPVEGARRVLTEEDWHKVVDINLTQAFVGCHVFGPHFLAQRSGNVINVSSFAALRPGGSIAYAAAKAGLSRFSQTLAIEWAPYGIRVNEIAPGTFPDPDQMSTEDWQRRQQQGAPGVPLGRNGTLREVGLLALYLASDAAAYVTGATIPIDGGRTLL
jgi:NAD(P)-dependent dehydrogenase (short-subunit alcohol dehydrogenase family)